MKTSKRKLLFTRIESTAVAGVPDLLIADEQGRFHMVELKFITGNVVNLSPHQVSWLTRQKHTSSWVLIKKQKSETAKSEIFLYKASDAIDLKTAGVVTVPQIHQTQPFVWSEIFERISPVDDVP